MTPTDLHNLIVAVIGLVSAITACVTATQQSRINQHDAQIKALTPTDKPE